MTAEELTRKLFDRGNACKDLFKERFDTDPETVNKITAYLVDGSYAEEMSAEVIRTQQEYLAAYQEFKQESKAV